MLNGMDKGSPRNSGGVRNSEFERRVRTTLSSCQQNTIYLGGLGLLHQQGWSPCSGLLSTLRSSATVYMTLSTKREAMGMVPTGRYGAKCTEFPVLLLKDN